MHFKKTIFDVFCSFMASLQMKFSQSSDHVEQFLIPFQKITRKNLSKNGFGICLTFLEMVTKCLLKRRFLTFFAVFYGLTSNAILSVICPCRMVFNTSLEIYGKNMTFLRARRDPQCPLQELEGRARRTLNFQYNILILENVNFYYLILVSGHKCTSKTN